MSGLAAIFRGTTDKSPDSDKLLHLYWNRAELKKEFATMRKERYRLQDRIKEQEGAAARLQQKLDHLEGLLLDPEWAINVVVYYQLRGLAQRCERKLARFAEQLKQQREQKQHNSLLVQWNETRTREHRVVEKNIVDKQSQVAGLEEQLEAERDRLVSMSGFLKIFRKRSITTILDSLREKISAAEQDVAAFTERLAEIKNRKPPENQGLDIPTKRSINFMIVAYAQQLYLHFADNEFAALAREAASKSAGAIRYGGQTDCEQMLARVQRRVDALEQSSGFASILQKRAQLVGNRATFRNDDDAVPTVPSISTLFDIDDREQVSESSVNLLGENYWNIAKVLSR